jgi:glycosyltransferase involved in cell wall biosynthesis
LFGFAELQQSGWSMDCNLRLPRISSVRETVAGWIERAYAPRTGIGLGDVCSVRAHLWQMNRARVVVATTDNTGLPAARLKASGELRVPLAYVSVGLPERIQAADKRSPARALRYRRRLAAVDRFVAYGHAEAEWLRQWLGDSKKVRFVPFGVDTEQWRPAVAAVETTDVLSVGSDPKRDFGLLAEYARRHPKIGVCLVVGKDCAAGLGELPANVDVRVQIPAEELKTIVAGARVVALPVKENTYSGATTTLLQCMAMGKAVAVSRVGAIREGYGFEDGMNLRWMEPGSPESLAEVVDSLLADEAARRRLGERARRHVVEHLGWDRYVLGIESAIAEWLGTKETAE